MKHTPFIIKHIYKAPLRKVWKAITDKDEMKKWYFDIKEFNPEVGFEFQFTAGALTKTYVHLCKIMEVIPDKKLAYSWLYEGYQGNSLVTFELFDEGEMTRLQLTHEGLETFPQTPDFAKENFEQGWTEIIGKSLKDYVEK